MSKYVIRALEQGDEDSLLATHACVFGSDATRSRADLGTLFDDGDRDSMNGGGGPDEIGIGVGDSVNVFRSNDSLFTI